MCYELMVFEPLQAPIDRELFMKWYVEQTG